MYPFSVVQPTLFLSLSASLIPLSPHPPVPHLETFWGKVLFSPHQYTSSFALQLKTSADQSLVGATPPSVADDNAMNIDVDGPWLSPPFFSPCVRLSSPRNVLSSFRSGGGRGERKGLFRVTEREGEREWAQVPRFLPGRYNANLNLCFPEGPHREAISTDRSRRGEGGHRPRKPKSQKAREGNRARRWHTNFLSLPFFFQRKRGRSRARKEKEKPSQNTKTCWHFHGGGLVLCSPHFWLQIN